MPLGNNALGGQDFFRQAAEVEVVTEYMDRVPDAVVEAIASHRGVDRTDLSTPLYEVIDPDALEALYRADFDATTESHPTVSFSYEGDRVVVAGPNDIVIQPQPADPAP
ncbi:HalOD1 output domain-containing protein [Halorarius halobius]|uniref:HalOD1 output domain-containing protein n=1 Tax=Halorarius halobius TaxID=2962671 RepID=UPI0020CCAD71|nr:HalOD1 output domain-containing protein [Halorarius halobius]